MKIEIIIVSNNPRSTGLSGTFVCQALCTSGSRFNSRPEQCSFLWVWIPKFEWSYIPLNRTQLQQINTPKVVTPSRWTMHKVINSGHSQTYQYPPKSYTAGLRQVSESTITPQSVQLQGEIPEEGRRKKNVHQNLCPCLIQYILYRWLLIRRNKH